MENACWKTVYASQILYILSVCLAKLSIVAFFFQSTIGRAPRMLCGILGGVIISWGISTSFAIAFQCHLPQPWKVLNNACIDNVSIHHIPEVRWDKVTSAQRAFWYSVASIDVISDLCIIALPFYTLKFIQIPPRTRLQVIVPFCARLMWAETFRDKAPTNISNRVVPAAIMHAVLLSSSFHSTDSTYDDWKTILATIVETNVDIITACIPFSRLVASSVQSGLLNSDLRILAPVYNGIQEYSLTDPSARTKSAEESGTQSLTSRRPLKFWKPVGRDHGSTTQWSLAHCWNHSKRYWSECLSAAPVIPSCICRKWLSSLCIRLLLPRVV